MKSCKWAGDCGSKPFRFPCVLCWSDVGLGIGGGLLVDAAVGIAGHLGMTPAAIGLTIVAIGTTFPELATSLLAARKGQADLAVGNIVGSNIFNILLVLGVASTVAPIEVPARGRISPDRVY